MTNCIQFTSSKTRTLFKDIEVVYTISFTATGISMFQMYSQIGVGSRVRALAAMLLLESITRPRAWQEVQQQELTQIEAAQGFIHWLDNYKRLMYDTQPDTDCRDKCWFGTATASCPGVLLRNSVPSPDPSDLSRLAAAAAEDLASCLAMFTTDVDRFVPACHPYATLRVPVYVVRDVRTGVTWLPQSLGEYNVSKTGGMMIAIHAALCRLRSANHLRSPILIDLNIHCRLLRAAY